MAGKRVGSAARPARACSPAGRGVVDRGRPRAARSSPAPRRRRPGCRRTSSRGRPGPSARAARPGRRAPRGACPLAMPLAVSRMSGSTPQCSIAHILPVRPAPDWISSATSRMPCLSQIPRRPWQEAVLGDDVAALALDRLDEDRRDLAGRDELVEQDLVEPAQVVDLAERGVVDAGQQRPEAGVVLGLGGGQRHAPYVRPWKAPRKATTYWPPRGVAGELDGRLDDLGAGVAEEDPGRAVDRRDAGQLAADLGVDRQVEVGRAEVDQLGRLVLDRAPRRRGGSGRSR